MHGARRLGLLLIFLESPFAAHALTSEDYAIYSVVLDHLQLTHSGEPRFAIVRDTVRPRESPCPSSKGIDFQTAPQQQHLEPGKLTIHTPYRLISESDAEQWFHNRFAPQIPTDPPGLPPPEPYPGSTDLIRLSAIFYNPNHTRAMVFVSATCGGLCGSFGWRIASKSNDGAWRFEPNPGCETIAALNPRSRPPGLESRFQNRPCPFAIRLQVRSGLSNFTVPE